AQGGDRGAVGGAGVVHAPDCGSIAGRAHLTSIYGRSYSGRQIASLNPMAPSRQSPVPGHRWLRILRLTLAALALLGALGAHLAATASGGRPGPEAVGAWQRLKPALFTAPVFLVHISYLYLVLFDHVFARPVRSGSKLDLLLAYLLCLAYVTTGLEVTLGWHRHWSLLVFLVLYVGWVRHSVKELSAHEPGVRSSQVAIVTSWLLIDVLLMVALAASAFAHFVFGWHPDRIVGDYWGVKDVIIAISLSMWLFSSIVQRVTSSSEFNLHYPAFLGALVTGDKEVHEATLELLKEDIGQRSRVKVLDFASASSPSTGDIMEAIGVDLRSAEVVRYDHDRKWTDISELPRYVEQRFVLEPSEAFEFACEADVILVSHSLYVRKNILDVVEILRVAKKDALVVFTGFAPSSMFAWISAHHSRALVTLSLEHLWNSEHLAYVVQKAKLANVIRGPNQGASTFDRDHWVEETGGPFAIMRKTLRVDKRSIAPVVGFIDVVYGDAVADLSEEIFEQMLRILPDELSGAWIPCDYLIYLFKAGGSGAAQSGEAASRPTLKS
ncbi:MAG TPA: hypothetical protein VIF57_01540, partial [Polyangia bacterium]